MYYLNLIDQKIFLFLNKILLNNTIIQYFLSFLVHKNESWLNVIFMLLLNIIAVLLLPKSKRSKAWGIILYCWLSFQLILLANNLLFQKIFSINRDSPSIVLEGSIKISEILNNNNLKDYSNNSFPAGHALVLTYWALFINLYGNKVIKIIAIITAILLIMPRMITGAHWFSDTACSLLLGWIYFKLSIWLANKNDRIKYCLH
jgi:Kdo2-lipid A phosphotransferase